MLGGYLGAGKTTLLNHVLRSTTEPVVVLVNDFGAINIDEALIMAADDHKITLANGCICCSLVDGLTAALEQVRDLSPRPARLVIEASGVANPASIAAYAHGRGLRLDSVATVLDAETIRVRANDRYVGDTVLAQIRAADLLVLNKIDLIDDPTQESVREWLGSLNGAAPILTASHGEVALPVLFGHAVPVPPSAPPGQPAEAIFETWSTTIDARFDRESLTELLASWSGDLIRVKGIVAVANPSGPSERVIVQQVGPRTSLLNDGPWISGPSTLVVIGLRGAVDAASLERGVLGATVGFHQE